ncbi:hypothetical protein GGQ88_002193 [Novosphingobium hassiacum]|uniref:PRC-barrel domain-containing protein n=1 Tax=Novosphingobium hassiacum TaxID=173676 RepID=A0A7W5ZYK4_9SPHN|nr:hypothetical protein [Novosphingobium hassiacum]MBB3860924.1 hypothetical protein [Novosphingobium hassiacum]
MRKFLIAAAFLCAAAPALADAPSVRQGQVIRDANKALLGTVDRVTTEGVRIILGSRFVTIPADTITVVDGKPVTSLTRTEVAKLK